MTTILNLFFAGFLGSVQLVSLDTKDMELSDFFRLMANIANLDVVLHPTVAGRVNLMIKDAPWETVLDFVLKNHDLGKEMNGSVMRIVPLSALEGEFRQSGAAEEARLQSLPLGTRIHFLNYARAEDLAPIIARMLSPRGSVIAYPSRNAVIIRDVIPPPELCH